MLHQLLMTDSISINVSISNHRRGAGPKVVARMIPGGDIVKIVEAQGRGGSLLVKAAGDGRWYKPFACYKEEDSDDTHA